MNYAKLFFQILLINSFFISTINCSDNRDTRLDTYKQAINIYNNLEEDHLYSLEGENIMIRVQKCLQDILQKNDASMCSPKLQNVMKIQSSTNNLLNKNDLKDIALKLKLAYKK